MPDEFDDFGPPKHPLEECEKCEPENFEFCSPEHMAEYQSGVADGGCDFYGN